MIHTQPANNDLTLTKDNTHTLSSLRTPPFIYLTITTQCSYKGQHSILFPGLYEVIVILFSMHCYLDHIFFAIRIKACWYLLLNLKVNILTEQDYNTLSDAVEMFYLFYISSLEQLHLLHLLHNLV
eukprot:GHVN01030337.1.p1 GENE.GHVN01030337.1~~GHVN01030337.1.p1  ORF type:complete len:126 (-),score=7.31 GHVN01030337.1:128-505(-)